MHKPLKDLPTFHAEEFASKTAGWKQLLGNAGPGGKRVVVEWSTGRGPNCFVYPATQRAAGFNLVEFKNHSDNDERYADYLEFDLIPQAVEALKGQGLTPQVICVDLRPLQVQRARRRALAAAAHAKTGTAAAH